MAGGNDYQDIAASQSNVVLARASASAGGGVGDYLSHVLVIPETVAAGTISVQDGSATAVNIFIAGTLPSLVPFAIPVQSYSVNGAWKITTGANVHVRAVGNFS
jgi:hypothetical protein